MNTSETHHFESINRQKLTALAALKKLLMYQAFAREL